MTDNAKFPDNFGYMCEKLPEYAERHDSADFQKGAMYAKSVAEILRHVDSALDRNTNAILKGDLARVLHALERIEQYFSDSDLSPLQLEDAYIFGDWIEREAKSIEKRMTAPE